MILCSFVLKNHSREQNMRFVNRTLGIDIKIKVDMQNKNFALNCRVNSNTKGDEVQIKEFPLDTKWNFLMLHWTKKQTLELILRGAGEP
jgi:hypothetical protein